MDRIDHLTTLLEKLKTLDKGYVVFGARSHKYQTKRWSLEEVSSFEKAIGHPIPTELREWLIRVGEGAAPNHGLKLYLDEPYQFGDPVEVRGDFEHFFEVEFSHVQAMLDAALSDELDEYGYRKFPPMISTVSSFAGQGLIGLGDAGCVYDYAMPLAGELKGKIFYRTEDAYDDDDNRTGSNYWPQGLATASPHPKFQQHTISYKNDARKMFGFFDWIESWLTDGIYLLENYDEYNRQLQEWRDEHMPVPSKPEGLIQRIRSKLRIK